MLVDITMSYNCRCVISYEPAPIAVSADQQSQKKTLDEKKSKFDCSHLRVPQEKLRQFWREESRSRMSNTNSLIVKRRQLLKTVDMKEELSATTLQRVQ